MYTALGSIWSWAGEHLSCCTFSHNPPTHTHTLCDILFERRTKDMSVLLSWSRGHPELNWGPLDLQSNALPLSYTPSCDVCLIWLNIITLWMEDLIRTPVIWFQGTFVMHIYNCRLFTVIARQIWGVTKKWMYWFLRRSISLCIFIWVAVIQDRTNGNNYW